MNNTQIKEKEYNCQYQIYINNEVYCKQTLYDCPYKIKYNIWNKCNKLNNDIKEIKTQSLEARII